MSSLFDPPAVNSARKLTQIFQQRPRSQASTSARAEFVPYEQERDHLGRLITARPASSSRNPARSLKCLPDPADSTIERVFRRRKVQGERSSDRKGKIRSSSSKQLPTPAVGHYDAGTIADRVKYPKAREVVFSSIHRHLADPPAHPPPKTKARVVHYHEVSTEPTKPKAAIQPQLNFNLPELEKYLEMRKLKLTLNDNFEQSHLKFKELARKGLVLAKTIRNAIDFD